LYISIPPPPKEAKLTNQARPVANCRQWKNCGCCAALHGKFRFLPNGFRLSLMPKKWHGLSLSGSPYLSIERRALWPSGIAFHEIWRLHVTFVKKLFRIVEAKLQLNVLSNNFKFAAIQKFDESLIFFLIYYW